MRSTDARRLGVATSYLDQTGRRHRVPAATVELVAQLVGSPPRRRRRGAGVGRAPLPAGRHWGFAVQLYGLRSAASWGMGDFADLAELARWSAAQGADLLLVNPLHAVAPTLPQEPSPYLPTSRQFLNPLYLRIEDVPAYRAADRGTRAAVDALRPGSPARIDRDGVWAAKRAALERLHAANRQRPPAAGGPGPAPGPTIEPATAPADPAGEPAAAPAADPALLRFATWCALADEHGPDFRRWPAGLRDPGTARAAPDRVAFHAWVQRECDRQLAAAQRAARDAGMAIGLVADLAVGVAGGGADAWALGDALVAGATVGAPPDAFNQLGQDWAMPPWHPGRLAEQEYRPYREMVRAALAHAGGLRVDHVLGLFRLWWVPAGLSAAEGAYVSYDAPALLDVLVGEAAAAGAVIVGEDLGTVAPTTARVLAGRGVLGCDVLWFAQEPPGGPAAGRPLPADRWRELSLASVTTHDLPTAAGFLAGEHVRVRAELGQLAGDADAEWTAWRRDRAALLDLLRREGLLGPGEPAAPDAVAAMYAHLAATPSRLVVVSLEDAAGALDAPNLPGTTTEYPNWRLPLPLTLEQLRAAELPARLAAICRDGLGSGRGGPAAVG